jgi:hypothetical protein
LPKNEIIKIKNLLRRIGVVKFRGVGTFEKNI